jgi:hypothetical protein
MLYLLSVVTMFKIATLLSLPAIISAAAFYQNFPEPTVPGTVAHKRNSAPTPGPDLDLVDLSRRDIKNEVCGYVSARSGEITYHRYRAYEHTF